MSIKALHWSFQVPLTGDLKLVLLALADRADHYGRCRATSTAEIAYACGMTAYTAANRLRQLCRQQWIVSEDNALPMPETTHDYLLLLNRSPQSVTTEGA